MDLDPPAFDIAGTAERTGHYVWLSSRLFEVIGGWVRRGGADPTLDASRLGLATRFSWQAEQWFQRLPLLAEVDRPALVRSPSAAVARRLDELAAIEDRAEQSDELDRFVIELDEILHAHLSHAEPLRDGPLLRTMERVRADLQAVRHDLRAA